MKQVIHLTKDELDYLKDATFLCKDPLDLIFSSLEMEGDSGIITIAYDDLDEIRDMFGEQLQIEGFDEEYCPTKQGQILESLIDKFYQK